MNLSTARAMGRSIFTGLLFAMAAASAQAASLTGSDFEIDGNANLTVDGGGSAIDWASIAHGNGDPEVRTTDVASGSGDDSFGQGTKEDTQVPAPVTGSIPPNKSDLLTFGVYAEETASGDFLHLFWHRVQEPNGNTNMDFEFNQSSVASANGITPIRTSGDLLVIYQLANGGTVPELFLSEWIDGSEGADASMCDSANSLPCWKTRETLAGAAIGATNTTTIANGNSDGLGMMSPRTFGEASIDMNAIVGDSGCTTFGSAYLKSRSSDSFTSAIKDYIAPTAVSIANCGKLTINKQDEAMGNLPAGVTFKLYDDNFPVEGQDVGGDDFGAEDTLTNPLISCTTTGSSSCEITNLLEGDYWVCEDASTVPAGYDAADPLCQPLHLAPGDERTFTFINPRQRGNIVVTKIVDPTSSTESFPFTSDFAAGDGSFSLMHNQSETTNGLLVSDLAGTYSVAESTPSGWTLTSATCDDGSPINAIDLDDGETVTCTFYNAIQLGSIKVVKQIPAGDPAQNFDFTSDFAAGDGSFTLAHDGELLTSNLLPSSEAGTYNVSESVPTGWSLTSATCDDGSPVNAIDLGPGEDVVCTFVNEAQRGAIKVVKTRKHAADGSGDHPHDGVTFNVSGGQLSSDLVGVTGEPEVGGTSGEYCFDGLLVSSAFGNYTVTETVPTGYIVENDNNPQTGISVSEGDCATATIVNFSNIPLTDLTVSVVSQVDGGTKSTIVCEDDSESPVGDQITTFSVDPTANAVNLVPGTYTCTIVVDP